MSEPRYTGVWIPREVLEDKTLTMMDRFVYAVVDGLDSEDGCWASNGYIAATCDLSERQVQNIIKKLVGAGYVLRVVSGDGKRTLRTVSKMALEKARGGEVDFVGGVKPISPGGVKPISPNNIVKDNIEDRPNPTLPFAGQEFAKAWVDWLTFRKQLKAKMTPITIERQFVLLRAMGEAEAIASIRQSIANGWRGLFPARRNTVFPRQPLTKQDHEDFFK